MASVCSVMSPAIVLKHAKKLAIFHRGILPQKYRKTESSEDEDPLLDSSALGQPTCR
jgi:hypothetical protein